MNLPLGYAELISIIPSFLVILLAVIVLTAFKLYGNISVSFNDFTSDFNLLTYGLLSDTSINAIFGKEYWKRLDQYNISMPKGAILLLIFLLNASFMAGKFRLDASTAVPFSWTPSGILYNLFMKNIYSTSLAVFSLLIFLIINSWWE